MAIYTPGHTYRVILSDDDAGPAQTLEFEAPSAEAALHVAQRHCSGREVELFEDGRSLGRVRCVEDGGYWTVSASPGARAGAPA